MTGKNSKKCFIVKKSFTSIKIFNILECLIFQGLSHEIKNSKSSLIRHKKFNVFF